MRGNFRAIGTIALCCLFDVSLLCILRHVIPLKVLSEKVLQHSPNCPKLKSIRGEEGPVGEEGGWGGGGTLGASDCVGA